VLAIGYAFGYALENLILESVNESMSSHILIPLSKKGANNLADVPKERRNYRAKGGFTFFSPLVLGSVLLRPDARRKPQICGYVHVVKRKEKEQFGKP
jgi:hypothetical protein